MTAVSLLRLLARPSAASLLRPALATCRPVAIPSLGSPAARLLSSSSGLACKLAPLLGRPRSLAGALAAPCRSALLPSLQTGRLVAARGLGGGAASASGSARVRFLSSKVSSAASSTHTIVQQVVGYVRQNPTVVAVICGMTLVMYGFYRGSVRLMSFFFNVSDKQIFNLGFIGGVFAMFAIGAAVWWTSRRLTFHVDDIYRAALGELRKHDLVTEKLGGAWTAGGFRGYSIESLSDAVTGSEIRKRKSYFEAPARRVQMIFIARGLERDAMVSLEAYKRNGEIHFDMLSLDFKVRAGARNSSAEHLFLKGTSDHVLFQEMNVFLDAARDSGRPEKKMSEAMGE